MIFVLRALGLGDLLTALPALRALRRAHPSEALVLAAPPPLAPLVRLTGAVDDVAPVPSAVAEPPRELTWHGPRPELAVNLHGKGPQSTIALAALRPSTLWSYGIQGAPGWDPGEHEVARWCRLVAAYGCPADPGDLYLVPEHRHDGPIVVHPGAARPERRWPAPRYAAVARELDERYGAVVVTAGPGERPLAAQVAAQAGLPRSAVVADVGVGALVDLVSSARLVVCGDTGLAHLATACRTPSVVLFGPHSPARWGPLAGPHRVLWRPGRDDDRAPAGKPHPSLLRIAPADVLVAAAELLSPR